MVNFIVPKTETLAEKEAIPSFLHSFSIPLWSVYIVLEHPLLISEDTAVNQTTGLLLGIYIPLTIRGKKGTLSNVRSCVGNHLIITAPDMEVVYKVV